MPQYYNISFTTRKEVIRYDSKGKEESRTPMDVPVTMNMLPLSAARSYENCDNYVRTDFIETQPRRGRRTAISGIGNATKDPQRDKYVKKDAKPRVKKDAQPNKVEKHKDARTGNMTGAING